MTITPASLLTDTSNHLRALRGAMPLDEAKADAACALAVRLAELAVGLPAGATVYARAVLRQRFERAYGAALPNARVVVAWLVLGAQSEALVALGRAMDAADWMPVASDVAA